MKIKLTYNIEIDEKDYKNLDKGFIKDTLKEAEEDEHIIDFINRRINGVLLSEDIDNAE